VKSHPDAVAPPPLSGLAPRVLVVDDDAAILRLIRLALLTEGFQVTVAVDGAAGLEAIQKEDFELLILDLQMPRMDGQTMFRELRSRGFAVPVLIISAFGAERARGELGAEAAMTKPFDVDDLLDRVKSFFDPPTATSE
jgi:DNA-binding response OmpR family regulator